MPELREASGPTINAEVSDIVEENQEPLAPSVPTALERVMAKHKQTFQKLAANED